jgi:phosphatidylserine/phosphatidylglycerophosphate/cardiolipin synthase-like enzyme
LLKYEKLSFYSRWSPDAMTFSDLFRQSLLSFTLALSPAINAAGKTSPPDEFIVLPEEGLSALQQALDSARHEIRIEVCALSDRSILQSLSDAEKRGVKVRVILDRLHYKGHERERQILGELLIGAGGELHVSHAMFPHTIGNFIIIDERSFLVGSTCFDPINMDRYRDFEILDHRPQEIKELIRVFENDWNHTAHPGDASADYNPTPPISTDNLMVSPYNSAELMLHHLQAAETSVEIYTELLGNIVVEAELAELVRLGVKVRILTPFTLEGMAVEVLEGHRAAMLRLKSAGVEIRTRRTPVSTDAPYFHARGVLIDNHFLALGAVSFGPESITANRGVDLITRKKEVIQSYQKIFEQDFKAADPY